MGSSPADLASWSAPPPTRIDQGDLLDKQGAERHKSSRISLATSGLADVVAGFRRFGVLVGVVGVGWILCRCMASGGSRVASGGTDKRDGGAGLVRVDRTTPPRRVGCRNGWLRENVLSGSSPSVAWLVGRGGRFCFRWSVFYRGVWRIHHVSLILPGFVTDRQISSAEYPDLSPSDPWAISGSASKHRRVPTNRYPPSTYRDTPKPAPQDHPTPTPPPGETLPTPTPKQPRRPQVWP